MVLTLAALGGSVAAQPGARSLPAKPSAGKSATTSVLSVRVVPDPKGPSVVITANRPIVPRIEKIDAPSRLIIDLPNAIVVLNQNKRIAVDGAEVSAVRVGQFQSNPPVGRVVVDLAAPVTWKWEGSGNRIMVRLRPADQPADQESQKLPTVPALTAGPEPIAVPEARSNTGVAVEAAGRVATGSMITAAAETAIMRLSRGGEIRVCPGTTLSVTSSKSGRDLMLGMSTGAMEAHYPLNASADSILTPDFRVLLAGPGEFHFAIGADSRGNTCVRALPGNTSPAIVSELMGDGTYQVQPAEQVVFRSGQVSVHDENIPLSCGCPPPQPAVLRAAADLAHIAESEAPAIMHLAQGNEPVKQNIESAPDLAATSHPGQAAVAQADPPPAARKELQVQVEAPLVFRAPSIPEGPALAAIPMPSFVSPPALPSLVLPPAQTQARKRSGFFGKVRGFFAGLFG